MLRYFKEDLSEFDQRGSIGSGQNMKLEFVEKLDELRHRCGFPFQVTSGYRSPEYNATVSSTGLTGVHTKGIAADIVFHNGQQLYAIVKHAMDMGFSGIGINFTRKFVHLDTMEELPRPNIWSY